MAKPTKKKRAPVRKGPGVLVRAAKTFAKGFDSSAGWMAKRLEPKPSKMRRASLEWTSKADGKPGERVITPPRTNLVWGIKQTSADKEIWRVTFIAGPTEEFLTWPPRDHSEACALAREHVVGRYGVYAESWEIGSVEFARKAIEDELPEDAKA